MHYASIAAFKTLNLYWSQSGPLNDTTEQLVYLDRRCIEAAQPENKRKDITTFLTSSRAVSSPIIPPIASSPTTF